MQKGDAKLMFALIRQSLFGVSLTEQERELFNATDLKIFFEVAKKHDVIHLVGKALLDGGLVTKEHPLFALCQKAQVMAVMRYEKLNFELLRVADLFEKAEIKFIPLKGSVLRQHYPEPWMRTSSDIDVLVEREDLEKAVRLLTSECGYTEAAKSVCDIAFNTPGGCHVELHFDLLSERFANGAHKILSKVWDYSEPKEGYKFWRVLSDDMFYYYHIAHMAKHFENGGCGIRPFMDIVILENLPNADKGKRDALLKKGNLLSFADGSRNLSFVWFGGGEHNTLTEQMETYLIFGGAFGTVANRVAVQQQKKGGKKGYALSRVFPDAKFMEICFPYVKNKKWLLPIAYVHRAFVILFKGNAANSLRELKANSEVDGNDSDTAKQMLDRLGLL